MAIQPALRQVAVSAVCVLLLTGSVSGLTVDLRSGRYLVEEGSIVERAGGYFGTISEVELGGELLLEVDAAAGTGRIAESSLWILSGDPGDVPRPFPITDEDLPLEDLVGTMLNSSTLELVSPVGGSYPFQTALLTVTASPSGGILDGFYDEGCCDRYVYTFESVVLKPAVEPGVPAVPALGATGATVLALLLGLLGAAFLARAPWRVD